MATDRALKKARHRLKRKRKQEELRKKQNGSAHDLLADGQQVTCYINRNWREQGMASIYVLKELRSGGFAMGAFLVDFLCCGLKDCWGQMEIQRKEFLDKLLHQPGATYDRADVETSRRLVAGGIRFARQNRFLLPAGYKLWLPILGVSANEPDSDLTGFGVGGDPTKLRYVGELEDLKKRLIGESFKEAVERTGLKYICRFDPNEENRLFGSEADEEDEDNDWAEPEEKKAEEADDELMEKGIALAKEKVFVAMRRWCASQGVEPHGRMSDVLDLVLVALLQSHMEPGDESEGDSMTKARSLIERALDCQGEGLEPDLREALSQLQQFVQSDGGSQELFRALGLPPLCSDFSLQ